MIKFEHLKKSYWKGGKEIKAIDDISLCFRDHEFVSILGPSGCGKTTLLNVIGALDIADSGVIYINGRNTANFGPLDWDAYRNNEIGFVFQNYYLIPQLTIYDNIGITLKLSSEKDKDVIHERILKALEEVGLQGLENSYPKQLSGGQCQRVAIARALINNPHVILADEPTGALDSKSAKQIMDILKNISKNHLVLMVTHNGELAEKYSDRIINLLDGKVVHDSNEYVAEDKEDKFELHHVHMSFLIGLKLGLKNMWSKKWRNFMTIAAASIGITSVGLILSMRTGITDYVKEVQTNALGDYPLIVKSVLKTSSAAKSEDDYYVKYPDTEEVNIEYSDYQYTDLNRIPDDYIDYLEEIAQNKELVSNYKTDQNVAFNLILKSGSDDNPSYTRVNNSYFYEICSDNNVVANQYDILKGTLPTKANEFALVVDEYNNLSYRLCSTIFGDINTKGNTTFSFDKIMNDFEFRLINNNDYYTKIITKDAEDKDWISYVKRGNSYDATMFNNSSTSCKITCILRLKDNAYSSLFNSGILYTRAYSNLVVSNATKSQMYKDQVEYGYEMDVFRNGYDLHTYTTDSGVTYKDEYLYNLNLHRMGALPVITNYYFYTDSFEDRSILTKYVYDYKLDDDATVKIIVKDYIESVTSEFSGLVNIFANVLLVISCVSLLVAGIMIAIISYISIMERKKEIGLLRALGARKKDILVMFLNENVFVGLLSGLIGIIFAICLCKPVSSLVVNLVNQYSSSVLATTELNLTKFNWWVAPILLFIAVGVTVLASLIPTISGCRKPPVEALRSE